RPARGHRSDELRDRLANAETMIRHLITTGPATPGAGSSLTQNLPSIAVIAPDNPHFVQPTPYPFYAPPASGTAAPTYSVNLGLPSPVKSTSRTSPSAGPSRSTTPDSLHEQWPTAPSRSRVHGGLSPTSDRSQNFLLAASGKSDEVSQSASLVALKSWSQPYL
ncbi:hypothetical protein HDU93_004794, partial [Gonapodya sp. JEL0774]